MGWEGLAKVALMGVLMVFWWGPRVAKWVLLFEAVTIFGIGLWLTWACFSEKGFGTVALVALLRGLLIFVPSAAAVAVGIFTGWAGRRLLGISANESASQWVRRTTRPG